MIYTELKKLHLIESILKETNDDVLKKVEKIFATSPQPPRTKFANFSNKLTETELEEFERNIETGCEQINEDDWK